MLRLKRDWEFHNLCVLCGFGGIIKIFLASWVDYGDKITNRYPSTAYR
ncbi:MAG: hypothetical protein AB1393_12565 [Candidatus Edwardsbacteria bacterium]